MVSSSSSSSTTPCLRVKIPATGERKVMINVKSPTSEMYAEVKEADKVKDLEKLIKKAWGDDYMALYYNSIKLKSDMFLSSYNLRDGSIVRVSVLAEPPHHDHHQSLLKKTWEDDYMALYNKSIKLKSDEFLSSYNLRDGSIVRVSVLAEPPHHDHHLSKSSCETKKNAKLQLETSGSNSNGGNGCGSIVFHVAKMLSQFCSSIFSTH